MSKNAEGWIRHRGGKCPVEAGTEVSTRHRDGKIVNVHHMTAYADASEASLKCVWSHKNDNDDIMAYRLHKPAERLPLHDGVPASDFGVVEDQSTALFDGGPLQWRDRIAEIDSTTQALTTERADLVQKLASEGFALIGRVVEPVDDMSDWKNWKDGDFLECVTIPEDHKGYYSTGNAYELAVNDISDDKYPVSVMSERGISLWCSADCFKFSHRIPSA